MISAAGFKKEKTLKGLGLHLIDLPISCVDSSDSHKHLLNEEGASDSPSFFSKT